MPALGEIATALNLELRGDPARSIDALAPIEKASQEHLTFVSEKRHLSKLSLTQAGAVILHPDWLDQWSGCALLSESPYVAYAKATHIFDNHPAATGIVHDTAVVSGKAQLGTGVTIDAGARVEENVSLGDRVWIGAGAFVGQGAQIGRASCRERV